MSYILMNSDVHRQSDVQHIPIDPFTAFKCRLVVVENKGMVNDGYQIKQLKWDDRACDSLHKTFNVFRAVQMFACTKLDEALEAAGTCQSIFILVHLLLMKDDIDWSERNVAVFVLARHL